MNLNEITASEFKHRLKDPLLFKGERVFAYVKKRFPEAQLFRAKGVPHRFMIGIPIDSVVVEDNKSAVALMDDLVDVIATKLFDDVKTVVFGGNDGVDYIIEFIVRQ